jgi:hypothetical protein
MAGRPQTPEDSIASELSKCEEDERDQQIEALTESNNELVETIHEMQAKFKELQEQES